MSWADVFPVLDDEMIARYQAEASAEEKEQFGELFAVKQIFNKQKAAHVVSTSLFWKPAWQEEEDYPPPSKSLMTDPSKHGLSSRFKNPWAHYVEPVLRAAADLKKTKPEVTFRVHLANDLQFAVEALVQAGCEVYLMRSSSLRASPGAMWRFLAMEEGCLVTMSDSDLAESLIHNIERTELMASGGLKYWRLPYFPGPGEMNHGNPGWYRTTNACRFGTSAKLPIKLLAEALLWNLEKDQIQTHCTVGTRKMPIWGAKWPDYCFDEYFINCAVFPRVAKEGILTLLSRKDTAQNYWFALDIEHCMKANPDSEIMHFGKPWCNEVRKFSLDEEEVKEVKDCLKNSPSSRPILSICVSLKNRSGLMTDDETTLELFPNCVKSLSKLSSLIGEIELVIADFSSNDWPLSEWLKKGAGKLSTKVIPMTGPFSKGKGINAAVREAQSQNLLLLDADMLVDETALIAGLHFLSKGFSFFPIVQLLDQKGETDSWSLDGTGVCFLSKDHFLASGGVPEFQSWGGEDDLFYDAVAAQGPVERRMVEGLKHQWHPISSRHENYSGKSWEDFRRFKKQPENYP